MTSPAAVTAVIGSELPPRWVCSVLRRAARLPRVGLEAVVIDRHADCVRSRLAAAILSACDALDRYAYPLPSSALEPTPLSDEVASLVTSSSDAWAADSAWILDLRSNNESSLPMASEANRIIRVRTTIVTIGDSTIVEAVRRRLPLATAVEVVRGGRVDTVERTVGAPHPLSVRHTVDAVCRRSEVLVLRALGRLE